jgi:hypothetical protein
MNADPDPASECWIQLFKHWRKKLKFSMISEVFRDNYIVEVSLNKPKLKYTLYVPRKLLLFKNYD